MSNTTTRAHIPLQRGSKNPYVQPVPTAPNPRGEAFARLIRDARIKLDLSQDALADMAGINRSTVIRWERGDASRPEPDQVRTVCKILGIDPIQAAIALGYLDEDATDPKPALDPAIAEVIDILEDPRVPDAEKLHWIGYLKYLRDQSRRQAG